LNRLNRFAAGIAALREASSLLKLILSETIDLLVEMGVKGNIRAKDVLASLNTFAPLN